MTSDCIKLLIVILTSKTAKSVALDSDRIFLLGFLCQGKDLFRYFIGLISETRDLKYYRDKR